MNGRWKKERRKVRKRGKREHGFHLAHLHLNMAAYAVEVFGTVDEES